MANRGRRSDEETPLLQVKTMTPLPWGQISLACLVLFAETISSGYMSPFINKFIGEIGITKGDDRQIGYYAGLMESIVSIVDIFSAWQWSRLSDFIGRRPVILLGLLSLGVPCLTIGLSRSYGMLIFSRCLSSIFDGNMGVVMSILGESTDNTNMTPVFATTPAAVSVGLAIATFYGGALAKPQERWPHLFRSKFWATYPYFLPSLVTGCGTLSVFFICALFLKESLPSKMADKPQPESPAIEGPGENLPINNENNEQPIPLATLLATYSVMIPIANSAMYTLMSTGICVLLPLFYSSHIGIGGLGLSPAVIGSFLGISAIAETCVQSLAAIKVIKWFGAKKSLFYLLLWMYPAILLLPVMATVVAKQGKTGPMLWILLVSQLTCMAIVDISYIIISMFVVRAPPNQQSLGSVNGLNQSFMSIARAVGALSAPLFAFSKQYNIMGGNFVYLIMVILATILIVSSQYLPGLEEEYEQVEQEMSIGGF